MLSIGIVGLPNVGKSTLFTALTKKQAPAENYPFCTIEPNVGMVEVPDSRLDKLAKISQPEKIVPTIIEFVDIAGLIKGANQGEGLGNKFLANIRECDAICQVVRDFDNDNIIHTLNRVDPEEDKSIINLELILADLAVVSKRLEKAEKESKSGDKKIVLQKNTLEKIKTALENETRVADINLTDEETALIKPLNLLTIKPVIYLYNSQETEAEPRTGSLKINIKQESDIASMSEEEQQEFISELGLQSSGLDKLIRLAYEKLGLISFFTTGPKETKAWTVKNGAKAPEAAGVIHTDFIKKFVRAQVINWRDFVNAGGEKEAKEQGLLRTEGKDYIIQDGDVCHFLINE